ncbi:ABC-type sulfate transport system, permease component [Caldisphaera lagunensis DSM 15908]|uniref:ABC-type sulfate transport system, permease component n=1 Tax=Caldisphaera lagunensis (strain DSM 15908 / JCM 11604 / ANMR 0165 / IC-154) TaxID=1056495 RepID=L0ADF6_CALLD|nr:ABC transporter permease subunit [Caldisphaera lagunensis]AFZ71147.1 ABC-type sulfate transport system, permease component [Caldisphaera lagunensis DSM 15908]
MKKEINFFIILTIIFSLFFLLFFAYPLVVLIIVGSKGIISSLENESFLTAIYITFIISTSAAISAVIFGLPLGYIIARYNFRFKEVIETLIDIPIVIPHIIVGVMIVLAFSSQYGLGPIFHKYGINVIDTILGAALAVSYLSSTYTIRVVESSIKAIDPELELISRSLGASQMRTFFSVILPNIWRSVINGALLTWARATSEAGALFIVAYYVIFGKTTVYPSPVFIYESYVGLGLIEAVKFSAALVVIIVSAFILFRVIINLRRH